LSSGRKRRANSIDADHGLRIPQCAGGWPDFDPQQEASRVAELEAKLREAKETLDAVRNGEVDAVVVGGASGQQVSCRMG
jgi:hypothetical protein